MNNNAVNYFLGCSSPEGFVSFFDGLYSFDEGWQPYILKGGAGTGKSTLMKKIAAELENRDYNVERVHCSSDPESLDAVICRELHFCIADGTSPHVIEPIFPGAVENIINLGEYWNKKILSSKSHEIIELCRKNALCHERCARFISAAGKVRNDIQKISEEAILEYKIHSYTDRFSRRRFTKLKGKKGKERKIFLSAVTPGKIAFFGDTVRSLAEEIILIEDKAALASGLLLEEMKNLALKNGYDVYSAFCPLEPSGFPEHIIIPALSLAFIKKHDIFGEMPFTRTIHTERFLESEKLSSHKNRISLDRRIINELIAEAAASLASAKKIHDEIERIYIQAMDFSSYDKLIKEILGDIL